MARSVDGFRFRGLFFLFFFSLTQELFGFFGVGVLFIDEILLEEEECMD